MDAKVFKRVVFDKLHCTAYFYFPLCYIIFFSDTICARIELFSKVQFSHPQVMACVIGICMQHMGVFVESKTG